MRLPRSLRPLLALLTLLAAAPAARAQFGDVPPPAEMMKTSAAPVEISAGGKAEAVLVLRIAKDWHVNANPAANENAIATEVKLAGAGGVTPAAPLYPKPKIVTLSFDPEPLMVWDGETTVRIPLAAAADAVNGKHTLAGTVMFQACNDQVCIAPAHVGFEVIVTVSGGRAAPAGGSMAASGGASDSSAGASSGTPGTPPPGGFSTAPPSGAAAATVTNPIAEKLAQGGWIGFLTIFLIGLALNLTPCVYPMLGVTVSIFGARRAAPPLQVFGYALLYVLGMALMYSTLGLVAALTGGLFGSFLQSPLVLIGIGVLLIALSLSMFGLYELQPPPWLLTRLGGNAGTSAAGVFLSGLVVGVFAAPCVGPPVVALLAVVGAKGDPWFGFTSFFTLAMGLGLPYLVLGTFSNLLQTLPRSGEWMVWVKKVFGVILVAVGLFYALLALAPSLAFWVIPAVLIVGGLYLGFFEKSAAKRPGFQRLKWATGTLAVIAGVALVATTPRGGLAFRPYDDALVLGDLPRSRPVMLDFSANWCVPCHELERSTFTDARVIAAGRSFDAFKVDLTRYDSPEADALRKRFGIRGVPTVVFLDTSGREIEGARVEGFLAPGPFLERMKTAAAAGARAAAE